MLATVQQHYDKISEDFNLLSKMIFKQFDIAQSMLNSSFDEELIVMMKDNEALIDGLEVKIKEEVINGIVLFSPRATDLRKIISFYEMSAYLERVGDLVYSLSKMIKRINLEGKLMSNLRERILVQIDQTKWMVNNAIVSFACEEDKLASKIIENDKNIDIEHRSIIHDIPDILFSQGYQITPDDIRDCIEISRMSYSVERIGDNATNIAEVAIYLIDGKNVSHIGKLKKQKNEKS
ncbi:phosphate signaling complex PhoU family protein [Porphyromonas pogonae]|uniref:phosphate signaling complex PhoU family protein n=1 Tax=Porphyromonas pogonae TaxID=867595 RepID=UPI002E77C08C|nr:PhoU domain-containing protein [Porphyromonas pogonae]